MTGRNWFSGQFDVPRETLDALDVYAGLLADWQSRMNLVGPSTMPHIWERHFADSAQLVPLARSGAAWLDLGAGAGFPGMVVALLDPAARVTMVESIGKKCRFLEAVREALGLEGRVEILNQRIEAVPPRPVGVITARALASLDQLFGWGLPHATASTVWLLPKGGRHRQEIDEAGRRFRFQHTLIASRTSEEARIVRATGVARI